MLFFIEIHRPRMLFVGVNSSFLIICLGVITFCGIAKSLNDIVSANVRAAIANAERAQGAQGLGEATTSGR